MDFLIESIKPFGRLQLIYLFLFGLINICSAMYYYSTVLFASEPELKCYLKGDNNQTQFITCDMWKNYTHSKKTNSLSPFECNFESQLHKLTIINDWDLVCDRNYLVSLSQTFAYIGYLCGIFNGFISDRYGRKKSGIIFSSLMILITLIYHILVSDFVQFLNSSQKFYIYCFYQFCQGFLILCIYQIVNILAYEYTTEKYHTLSTNILITFFIIGEIIIMNIYYLTKNWRETHLFISCFFIVSSLLFIVFTPESPKWLFEVNNYTECFRVLNKFAKINGKKLNLDINEVKNLKEKFLNKNTSSNEDKHEKNSIMREIFCNKKILLYISGLFIVSNSKSLQYASSSLGMITTLDINPYLIFILNALFELLGSWFCVIGDWIGRKKSFNFCMFTVGICSLCFCFIPEDDNKSQIKIFLFLKVFVILLSRFMQSTSHNLSIIYFINLFDVKIRSTVILFLSSAGSISTLIAPQINMLKSNWKFLPHYINALAAFISSIILFFMPEIQNKLKNKSQIIN